MEVEFPLQMHLLREFQSLKITRRVDHATFLSKPSQCHVFEQKRQSKLVTCNCKCGAKYGTLKVLTIYGHVLYE